MMMKMMITDMIVNEMYDGDDDEVLIFCGFPYLNYSGQVSPSLAEVEKRMVWKCGSRWNYMIATLLIIRGHATKASDYDYS